MDVSINFICKYDFVSVFKFKNLLVSSRAQLSVKAKNNEEPAKSL